jgi:predicted nucleic acid-binding protein
VIAFLCDTDWMVDYLNGREPAIQLLSSLADQGVGISIITYAELYEGVANSPSRQQRLGQLEELVQTTDVIPIDFDIARAFGELRSSLRASGQPIPDLDALIAATALRYDLTLLSRDRHFERVAGLKRR